MFGVATKLRGPSFDDVDDTERPVQAPLLAVFETQPHRKLRVLDVGKSYEKLPLASTICVLSFLRTVLEVPPAITA